MPEEEKHQGQTAGEDQPVVGLHAGRHESMLQDLCEYAQRILERERMP